MSLSISLDHNWSYLQMYYESDYKVACKYEDEILKNPNYVPKADELKTYVKVSSLRLHYSLNLKHADKSICDYIDTSIAIGQVTALTNHALDSNHDTALMVATNLGRVSVIARLLQYFCSSPELKVHLNAQNCAGWTALHFSSLRSRKIHQMMLDAGADPNIKNNYEGTALDLTNMTSLDTPSHSASYVYWETEIGVNILMQDLIKDNILTDATGLERYRDFVYVKDPNILFELNKSDDHELNLMQQYLGRIYDQWQPSGHHFRIAIARDLLKYAPKARKLVTIGALFLTNIIGEYAGVAFETAHHRGPYVCGCIDALKMGNHTRYANTAFPNAALKTIRKRGIPLTFMIVTAPEGIKAGEEIVINYGVSYSQEIISRPYVLQMKGQIEAFFKKGKLETLAQFEHPINSAEEYLIKDNYVDRLTFPLCFPTALIYLHYKSIINAAEWLDCIKKKEGCFKEIVNEMEKHKTKEYIEAGLLLMIELDKKLEDNEMLKSFITNWVINNIDRYSFMNLLGVLDQILKKLPNINLQSLQVITSRAHVFSYIRPYDIHKSVSLQKNSKMDLVWV